MSNINDLMKISLRFLILFLFIILKAEAGPVTPYLVNPNIIKKYPAIVLLNAPNGALCSGTTVGLNPPTVITARHCTESNIYTFEGWNPLLFKQNFDDQFFNSNQLKVAGDMAILVYPKEAKEYFLKKMKYEDIFKIDPSYQLKMFQNVTICGYGSSGKIATILEGVGTQRCGSNNIILEKKSLDFSDELREHFGNNRYRGYEQLTDDLKIKWIHKTLQQYIKQYGPNTRMAVSALILNPFEPDNIGSLDKNNLKALVAHGDSGGPLFVESNSSNILIGINSISTADPNGQIIGSTFWSINHSWSQALIQRALKWGADINGL